MLTFPRLSRACYALRSSVRASGAVVKAEPVVERLRFVSASRQGGEELVPGKSITGSSAVLWLLLVKWNWIRELVRSMYSDGHEHLRD
jgi:hypothetical protein